MEGECKGEKKRDRTEVVKEMQGRKRKIKGEKGKSNRRGKERVRGREMEEVGEHIEAFPM